MAHLRSLTSSDLLGASASLLTPGSACRGPPLHCMAFGGERYRILAWLLSELRQDKDRAL